TRQVTDAGGIGAHVGDQTGRAGGAELHALVELLRDAHGSLRRQPQPCARILLQRALRIWKWRVSRGLLRLDASHHEWRGPVGDRAAFGGAPRARTRFPPGLVSEARR